MVTKPSKTLTTLGVSYEKLKDTKRMNLALRDEESKPVHIATDLRREEERKLIELLLDFRDVFA